MLSPKRLRFTVVAILVLFVLFGVCLILLFQVSSAPRLSLASFTENGVTVEIALERESSGQTFLAGTFMPTDANFHLYSKDLPREGLDGVGRPTLLEIVSSGGVRPTGQLVADQPTIDLRAETFGHSLLVYSTNPVTLRLPVALSDRGLFVPTELSITYMACSRDTCLPPVMDRRVSVITPGTIWHK